MASIPSPTNAGVFGITRITGTRLPLSPASMPAIFLPAARLISTVSAEM
ncbi:unannotated protein [freshwater metagenome]|uniref:Unannotated protein n=1 Tax=freshwater metagenome TaxID=449393 RepID=A0A6J7RY04_9ZZZZ